MPALVPLAPNVWAYEDLNGDLKGNLAFTTNSLIVVTTDGVAIVDPLLRTLQQEKLLVVGDELQDPLMR